MGKNLTDQAIYIIKNAIVMGDLKLGEAISEIGICDKYNLSKTPVREALVILSHEGLVNKISRKGCFVFDITINEIEEIAELRFLLEEYAIKKSLNNNKKEFINNLNNIFAEMENASSKNDFLKYLEIDTKFHNAFFDYSDNKHLTDSYKKLSGKVEALRFYVVKKSIEDGEGLKSHRSILDAIINEDYSNLSVNLNKHMILWLNKYKFDFKIGL